MTNRPASRVRWCQCAKPRRVDVTYELYELLPLLGQVVTDRRIDDVCATCGGDVKPSEVRDAEVRDA